VQVGASPRGALALVLTARALAVLRGRDYVVPEDVKDVGEAALAHRLTLRPESWMQRISPAEVVRGVLGEVPVPTSRLPGGRS
jgi:MoxR-like ATPase